MKQQSNLDRPEIKRFIENSILAGETNCSIVRLVKDEFSIYTSEAGIRRFRLRHGVNPGAVLKESTKIDGDSAEGTFAPTTKRPVLDDPDTMLRQRGLNPDEWAITHVTANEYQGPNSADAVAAGGDNKITYYQTKFTAAKTQPTILMPARSDGWKRPSFGGSWGISNKLGTEPELVVICGDQQAPYVDENLHLLFCKWLSQHRPSRGVLLGDTVDLPTMSKHKPDPESDANVNECTQSGYNTLRGYVDASVRTDWVVMPGNHCVRINDYLAMRAPEAATIRRATMEGGRREEPVLSLKHLMRLDELGIEWIDPKGPYTQAQYNVNDKLAIRHGWLAKNGGGNTAYASLNSLGYSLGVGHTHRQSIVHKTIHDINGHIGTITAFETGCMCVVEKTEINGKMWPNYTGSPPDWHQGFATASIWPDGFFRIDLATYVNKTLLWRDERYS